MVEFIDNSAIWGIKSKIIAKTIPTAFTWKSTVKPLSPIRNLIRRSFWSAVPHFKLLVKTFSTQHFLLNCESLPKMEVLHSHYFCYFTPICLTEVKFNLLKFFRIRLNFKVFKIPVSSYHFYLFLKLKRKFQFLNLWDNRQNIFCHIFLV